MTGPGPLALQDLISKMPSAFCVRGRTLVVLQEAGTSCRGAARARAVGERLVLSRLPSKERAGPHAQPRKCSEVFLLTHFP